MVLILATSGCLSRDNSNISSPTASVAVSPAPPLPADLPPWFDDDVGSGGVPAAALIPIGATVSDSWITQTAVGEAIVVSWEVPGDDPFRQDRGIAAWRRFDDGGAPWRPVWGAAFPGARDPVLGISTTLADVTGDGSPDALVLAEMGGSGGCGIVAVVDLSAGGQVYRSRGCDRRIEPATDPAGLVLTEAVFAPGDPHCCPSSLRTTFLAYVDGSWRTASTQTTPT